MSTLNYQAILDRVYQHFVTDEQPPGSVDGYIVYHQYDDRRTHCPCAIGLFDTHQRLDASIFVNQLCPDVENLFYDEWDLLCEIFGVDRITKDDVIFLQGVQSSHDAAVQKFEADRERFREELTTALNKLSDRYALRPVAL